MPTKSNRSAERQRNRKLHEKKAKQAQKQREKRAAATAAFIARTDFPPSPSPSTSSSSDVLVRTTVAVLDRPDPLDSSAIGFVGFHDVAPPLGPEQFDYDDSGGEYHIAVELGLTTLWS